MGKRNNSQECVYGGYKLSCLNFEATCSDNVAAVSAGCDEDDTFYYGAGKAGRVLLFVELSDGQMAEIDLEDVLGFARRYCNGVYERVLREVTPDIAIR
jgi:hypothetical protein